MKKIIYVMLVMLLAVFPTFVSALDTVEPEQPVTIYQDGTTTDENVEVYIAEDEVKTYVVGEELNEENELMVTNEADDNVSNDAELVMARSNSLNSTNSNNGIYLYGSLGLVAGVAAAITLVFLQKKKAKNN